MGRLRISAYNSLGTGSYKQIYISYLFIRIHGTKATSYTSIELNIPGCNEIQVVNGNILVIIEIYILDYTAL